MSIGNTIKILAIKKNMTQQELAKQAGISNDYISMIVNGQRRPSIKMLLKISGVFNLSLAGFLFQCIDYTDAEKATFTKSSALFNKMLSVLENK